MSKICGYNCEHNKGGVCQILICDKSVFLSDTTAPMTGQLQCKYDKLLNRYINLQDKHVEQLDNWNKLKEWLKNNIDKPNIKFILETMQELEQESDSNE